MALSQIQCLDENHVNPRTHESKPEFFYCEDQRLAVETLLRDGRDAFVKYLEARGLRGFLSDPELETLAGVVEPYDPGAELFQEDDEDDPTPLSQHYWPDLSDTSVPQMDLGWPDSGAYRGVTRTTVYTQPPLDGQTHIKEVVRKLIAQAQKMIAVAMDVFTDVDIFRDLLDAGFKRRVSVYILLERATLPHFLSMCQRANMHAGHFKHLRVRCTGGNEFCTRSCHKVKGRMGHRFMFIDGDKAVSGSYSFTWMSSRLDRNLITVVTGQATDSFDRLFRFLFGTSGSVDLRQVAMDPEPEPEPLLQPATVAPPSADIARKLYSPKYALVALSKPNPTTSVGLVSPKETQSSENSKKRRRRAGEEATKDAPPLHPGLMNLEKAYLIPYLPIWPEPDPSSDVIGFINIRDANKPNQVHLQRSEMFGTSQAIRFSSPFSEAKKTLPEVTNPKQTTAKHEEAKKLQPAQNKTEAEKLVVADKARLGVASSDTKSEQEAPEQKLTVCENKSEPDKDATKAVNTENKLYSKTATNQGARHIADVLRAQTLPQSISQEPQGGASHTTHTVCTSHPNTRQEADTGTGLNAQSAAVDRTHSRESNGAQNSPPPGPADSNTEQDTPAETVPSHPAAVLLKPETQTPVVHRHVSSTSVSFTTLSPRLPSSSSSSSSSASPSPTSAPPVPKPRTVQLVIQDGSTGNGLKLPELCEFKRPQAVKQTPPGKEPETDPEQQDESGSKTEARKGKETTGNPEEAPQQTQKTEVNEADGRHDGRAGARVVAGTEPPTRSDVLITDVPKAAGVNTRGIIPKDVDPKSSTSTDCRTATGCGASVHTDEKATGCELTKVPSENVTRCKTHLVRAQESQRISYCQLTPQDVDVFQAADASEPPIHRPVSTCRDGAGDGKTSRGETPTLSGSAGDSSSTRRCKEETTEAEGTAHQDDGREEEQNGRKVSVAEREARRTDRRDGEETKRSVDSFRQREDSRETAEKGSDARRRKEVLHQSAAGGPLGGGVTAGQSANEGPETKRWCTGDLKPKSLSSERERSDKVSSLPHTLPKSQRIQQLDSLDLSPPRVPRPPRPLSANQTSSDRPSGSRQPNQTALPGSPQVLDNNPHRPPPSPSFPGPAGSAPGRKQVSDSQQSLVPRQPPAAPSRTRDGPTQNQTASHKPQSPFLFTQLHPQPRSQVLSAQEAHEQEDGKSPFSFSFSRLYSLKGLKDKMSKLPAQSKRGGSSPPVQGQGKSTS